MGILNKLLPNKVTGDQGEDAAARHLARKGMRVLDRNWRFRQWELDLVCRDGDTLVFVEVKTRKAGSMGTPGDALTPKKQARLVKAASHYLSKGDLWDCPCRFDLVSVVCAPIDGGKKTCMNVEHIENAFDASGYIS